jgi:hypothetical protein
MMEPDRVALVNLSAEPRMHIEHRDKHTMRSSTYNRHLEKQCQRYGHH